MGLAEHSPIQNSPPVLYVPERNWRISENAEVGEIIARVHAVDAENDNLVFGLQPLFNVNFYPHVTDNDKKLPFRIDPARGIVYLNESLLGRGGENFLLYVTVTDGMLPAKNEILVNILKENNNTSSGMDSPPSVSHIVRNFSNFLPRFDMLPGVQNTYHTSNRNPVFSLNSPYNQRPINLNMYNFNSNQVGRIWPQNIPEKPVLNNESINNGELEPTVIFSTPLNTNFSTINYTNKIENNNASTHLVQVNTNRSDYKDNEPSIYSLRTTMIPLIVAIVGIIVTLVGISGYLYRRRLCPITKNIKKCSKGDISKKSQQRNLQNNLTDDSQNSMVLQQWNGPRAFGNRYVPWERDRHGMQHGAELSVSTNTNNSHECYTQNSDINSSITCGNNSGMVPNNIDGRTSAVSDSKYDQWEFPRYKLKFFNILGEGAFGQVWRCEASDIDGSTGIISVAVKTLKENASETEKKDLLSELDVMKSLEPHINVVRLLGCCTEKDPIFVIIEYVNKGKLQTYLRNSRAERYYGNTYGKSNVLTSGDLTSFMYQIAKGMDYLTSRGIIHRDLAARNILISDDHTCKVADFGFARDIVTSKIYERKSEGKLPIRWMAIESLYDNIFTVKSDIWSFGILMWEIVTLGSTPYPGISAADVMRKVRDGYRLEKPEHCRRELYNIMYYCWSNDANSRPSFSELVYMLDKLLHTEMDYIELERFPDHNYYNIVNVSEEKL